MSNLETFGVIHPRDIIWLKKIYKDWVIEKSITHKTVDNYENNLPLIKNINITMTNEAPPDKSKEKADENKKNHCQLRRLNG
jgi:hypothetical protein